MKERYAFRYNEFLQQQKEDGKIFTIYKETNNPLLADVQARFQGLEFVDGKSNLTKLGIRIKGHFKDIETLLPLTDIYGADAIRIALLENLPLTDENLTGCWRFIGNFWCALKQKTLIKKEAFDVFANLQVSNYKQAFINLKSLIKTEELNADILMLAYPFMPHLILSFCSDIHEQMALFWRKIQKMQLPDKMFIEINGKKIIDFYTNKQCEKDIIQEVLSFKEIQHKIKNKPIKKTFFVAKKGVNFVV